ncbi:PKD domain-containing protein, partial [bacterium]|nr:PKD domain-containing protein [bacterium]
YPEGMETGPCLANADFVGEPVEGLEELCVQFSNLSENASSHLWDFGDGTTSTETDPLHCYSVAIDSFEQYYTVLLTIDGDYGTDAETKIDYIHVGKAPIPEFVFADTVLTDTSICFTFENLSEYATDYLWDLGDGITSTEISPSNCYLLTGDSISVTLTASNSFADSTITKKFFAGEAVIADFMAADTVYDKQNVCMRVTFQNLSLNAVEYLWDFGDGQTSTDENPTHCFSPEEECYTITLTAISAESKSAVEIKENYICVPQPVVADFAPDTDWGINRLCVNFQNLSLNSKWYWWKFGDGRNSAAENPQHCYNSVRKYFSVTLFAANELFMDVVTKTNLITVIKGTSVNFYASPIAGIPGTTVQFTNHAGGITTKHEWSYGDGDVEFFHHGTMSREKVHPTHEYENEGAYTVKLRSWGQGGEDSLLVKNLVYIDEDYEALNFVDGTPTTNAYPWTNAIDHDVISGDCKVLAYRSYHPEAVFIFADSTEKDLHKVRLMGNNVHQQNWRGHIAKEFEIYASTDGFTFDLAYAGQLSVWDRFEVFEFTPILAKFVKLVLVNGIGGNPPYLTISEFQTFASELAPIPKDLAGDGLLITEYALTQNYPNPFNPSTQIRFELPETANVVLKVFNVMGQEVKTLVNQEMNAGRHEVVFDAADVNSGTYFYQISANEFSEVRRMTFIK